MTIAEKLQKISDIKADIKTAINDKGVEVTDSTPFEEYPNKIAQISGGSGKVVVPNGLKFGYSTVLFNDIDTSNVTDMSYMFYYCKSITTIPQIDTSNVTDMKYMFIGCSALTSIPQLDTAKVGNMKFMFEGCRALTSIPQLDTSNVTDMNNMFAGCNTLTSIPQLDTHNVTNMNVMFSYCYTLTTIPQLDTSNVTDMSNMFMGCSALTSIPPLDTHNVTDMYNMLYDCVSLTSIPALDTSNVTDMSFMFYGCSELTTVNGIDFSGFTSPVKNLFGYGSVMPKLTRFIVNGKINVDITDNNSFKKLINIDYDSVKSILEAANRTDNTNGKALGFNITMSDPDGELVRLVDDCTNKGWYIYGLTLE